MAKRQFIKKMFSDIAGDYDKLNRIISFNLDMYWRRIAISKLNNPQRVLDLCAGTGDMAVVLSELDSPPEEVVLLDINDDMLRLAKNKLNGVGERVNLHYITADVENIPFDDDYFDSVTMGFSLRNLENIPVMLKELDRVCKKGAVMSFLDIAHPESRFVARMFYLYFYKLVPVYTRLFTGKKYAYNYLPASLKAFHKQKELIKIIKDSGFENVSYQNILTGICAIYTITK